jgi:hypothetical protein
MTEVSPEKPKKRILGRKKAPPAKKSVPTRTTKKWQGPGIGIVSKSKLKELWADPEWRKWKLDRVRAGEEYRPGRGLGVLDGTRKTTIGPIREQAKQDAEKVWNYMVEKKVFQADNDVAEESVKTLVEILRLPGAEKDRISAAKALLEYTQRKPAAYSEVTLNKAETFLEAVLMESNREEGTDRSS